jgi:hypothetical protein
MSFRSPNRSILDESDDAIEDDDSEINIIIDHVNQEAMTQGKSTTLTIGNENRILDDNDACLDSSFMREDGLEVDNVVVDAPDIARYRAALNEANDAIRQLYTNLQKYSDEFVAGKEPIVTIPPNVDTNKMKNKIECPGYKEQCAVDAQMLDSENFISDWVDLTPPLPNPPDHDLESPIVAAVLELWTSDRALHETLLDWIDQVLSGSDIDTIPPLTLSSLDNQARDGLLLHVLPFLLRRPDVLVNLKTRVHRRTTYDLSVEVDHAVQPSHDSPTHSHSHPMPQQFNTNITASGTPSNITTNSLAIFNSKTNVHDDYYGKLNTPRSNNDIIPAMSRLSYDEMAEDIVVSDTSQPGLMSTLGSALGGLLLPTRNNNIHRTNIVVDTTNDDDYNINDNAVAGEPSYLVVPPSSRRSIMNGTNMPTIMESPRTTTSLSDYTSNDDVVRFVEMDHDTAYSNHTKHLHQNNSNTIDQPYHRVVSAPPGRIGITFIDYRGHCTVSDVYHDSPLIGWIFPSDILIMIDDIPVSGMPIRDIIKLLKDRTTNPQRALRVISSHAMNELTLNASVIVNDATAG